MQEASRTTSAAPSAADPFVDDPDGRPGLAIKQAEQALMREKTRVLRAFGLSVPQYAAMLSLSRAREGGTSGAQLARRCGVTPQAMASLLAILEGRGLVSRGGSPVHAKVQLAQLTEAGRELVSAADAAAVAVERRLADAFTDAELATLRTLLARATAVLSTYAATDATPISSL